MKHAMPSLRFFYFLLLGTLGSALLVACGDARDGADSTSAATPPATAAPAISVQAVPVQRRDIQAWTYSQGTARSRQREFLTFTQQGMVTYVDPALRVGSPVQRGQLIAHQAPARVTADLQAAKAALQEAQANLALAEATRQRYETLIAQRSAAQQELDQAVVQTQQAKAARDHARAQVAQAELGVNESRLISPINGVLARLNIERGRYFMPSAVQTNSEQNALRTVPALVIDPTRFEVRVDMPSYEFQQLSTGARAVIGGQPPLDGQHQDPQQLQSRTEGLVHAISPSLDPDTRTFEVIVHSTSANPGLQDGQFVAVWIARPQMQQALVIPLEAVRHRSDQSFVFVADPASGKAVERRVELGPRDGSLVAVLEGVEAGDMVITEGRSALQDGQTIRVLQAAPPGQPQGEPEGNAP